MNLSNAIIKQLQLSNDKLVLINETGEPQAVLMSYTAYETLIKESSVKREIIPQNNQIKTIYSPKISNGLTSDKLLDKINYEIAEWKERAGSPIGLDEGYVLKNNKAYKPESWDEEGENSDGYTDEDDEALYFETMDEDNGIPF